MAEKRPPKGGRRAARGAWKKRLSEYREELIKLSILGVPLAVLGSLISRISDTVLEQPRQAIVVLVPIAVLGALAWWRVTKGDPLTIDRRTLLLLGAYILFFSVAAETRVLDWKRDPSLFGQPSERSWLLPVSWGDWRYRLVPKVDGDDLVVVLREPTAGKTRERARTELVTLIGLAAARGARGVAFDYTFEGESAVDLLLCTTVESVGIPVFLGYGFERFEQRLNPLPLPSSLQSCAKPDHRGHLVGFLDADRTTRVTPLFLNNDRQQPALSLVVARALSGEPGPSIPDHGLLHFVEPAHAHLRVRLEDLLDESAGKESARNALNGRFVLVGEDSGADSFDTPFGRKPGVIVHADAIHSLVHSHYIRTGPWWLRFFPMLAFCYGLAVWCAHGWPEGRLFFFCLVATVCFCATAVVGIVAGPLWFDAFYPSAAVWLLLPLLLSLRRLTRARP